MSRRGWLAAGGSALVLVAGAGLAGREAGGPPAMTLLADGVRVTLELVERPHAGPLRPGGPADLVLRLSDATSGVPLTGLHPYAWASPSHAIPVEGASADGASVDDEGCAERVRTLGQGSLATQATTSLNQHYIYTLNGDASLSVVNPLLAFQRTRLRELVSLAGRPADAVSGFDADTLLVSIPSRGEVAILDTLVNRVRTYLPVGGRPGRLWRAPGGARVWTASEDGAGWAVIDTLEERVAGLVTGASRLPTVVFDADGARAFVATERGVRAVDAHTLATLGERTLDAAPVALASAPLAGAFLVADETGRVEIVDARTLQPRAALALEAGVTALGVDPSGRWGFAATDASVVVIDTATGSVRGVVEAPRGSDEIVFTDSFAYVTGATTASVAVIALQPLYDGGPASAAQIATGTPVARPDVRAPSITPLPGGDGVLIARPGDRTMLYYKEGMNAPIGGIGNSSPTPAEGLVVLDRGLREVAPGVHRVGVNLAEGRYEVPVLLDAPRTVLCFALRVGDAPPPEAPALTVTPGRVSVRPGEEDTLRVRISRAGEAVDDLGDVRILVMRPGTNWQRRLLARPTGDGGYEADIRAASPGDYRALVESRTLGVGFGDLPPIQVVVEEEAE
ncbi:MAG: hypothetical protein Q8P18_16940 [Pseudomonadota bacterium]|nr:hypothetical protein [Pseudomonadota bacterium]